MHNMFMNMREWPQLCGASIEAFQKVCCLYIWECIHYKLVGYKEFVARDILQHKQIKC